MPNGLKVYKIEDSQTGKVYEIEGPEDASEDEIYSFLESSLSTPAPVAAAPQPQQAPVAAPVAGPVPVSADPLNAIQNASNEVVVPTKAWQEVPGAREFAEGLFWEGKQYNEAAELFAQKFPGVKFSPEQLDPRTGKMISGPALWAEHLARAQTPEGLADYRRNGVFAPVNVPTGIEDVERPDSPFEQLFRSGQRGAYSTANLYRQAGALAAGLVGADETSQQWLDDSLEQDAALDLNLPSGAGGFTDIESTSDAAMWFSSVVGQQLPELAGQIALGGVAGIAAKQAIKGSAEAYTERRVAELVAENVAEAEARNIAKQEAQAMVAKTILRAQVGTVAADSVAKEGGGSYQQTYARTGELKPFAALTAGLASGTLEAVMPARIFSKIGGASARDAFTAAGIKRFGKETFTTMVLEGGTEGLQSIITQLPSGEVDWNQVVESMAAGAAFGGTVGAGVATYENLQDKKNAPPAAPPGPNRSIPEDAPTITVPDLPKDRRSKAHRDAISTASDQVTDRITALTEGWENGPEFEVHDNFKSLRGVDNRAIGAIHEGRVVINTENVLKEAKRRNVSPDVIVNSVTFHEGLGHHGLAQVFGKQLEDKLATILESSPVYKQRVDKWLKKNPKAYEGVPNRDLLALEEILAERSENGQLPASYVNQFKNIIKEFGRKMGLSLEYSTREVETILGMAHAAVVGGKGRGGARENGFLPTRYMYAGEAAETADKFSLQVAEYHERKGDDVGPSGVTRNRTGWFKGPDGKWRFEISDHKAKAHILNYDDTQSLVDELDDFGDTSPDSIRTWQYSSGLDFLKENHPETTSLYLSQVLDHEELFEAYPELREIQVYRAHAEKMEPGIKKNYGSFHPVSKVIYINSRLDEKEAMSTLLHEVQHAVQTIEGFAKGGNTSSAILSLPEDHIISTAKNYEKWQKGNLKRKKNELAAFSFAMNDPDALEMSELDTKVTDYEEYLQTPPEVDDELERWVREGAVEEQERFSRQQFEAEKRFLEKLGMSRKDMTPAQEAELDEVYEFLNTYTDKESRESYLKSLEEEVIAGEAVMDHLGRAIKNKGLPNIRSILYSDSNVSFQAYQSLFGEVEARDVQQRQNLGPMAREDTVPYTSEGIVSPDEYVFDMADDSTNEMAATVYHGSPHDFDQFDHSKMGTGEGAQIYGWGTYLTETRGIAEGYKKRLSRPTRAPTGEVEINGQPFSEWFTENQPMKQVRNPAVPDYKDGRKAGRKRAASFGEDLFIKVPALTNEISDVFHDIARSQYADEDFQTFYRQQADYRNDVAEQLREVDSKWASGEWSPEVARAKSDELQPVLDQLDAELDIARKIIDGLARSGGKLYEVDIPDDAVWLEWDKPVSEQPRLQEVLRQLDIDWQQPSPKDLNNPFADAELAPITGAEAYHRIESKLGDYPTMSSDEAASKTLDAFGIIGTKYLDGFSRNKGEGSYNYVVFNDKTPKIVNKYMMMSSPDKVEFTPEEIESMDPADLVESKNAMDLLERMTQGYTPVVLAFDDLEAEVKMRKLNTSQILGQKSFAPGELTKRLFMFDIAMTKMDEQLTKLYAKIMDGTASATDRSNFLKTEFKRNELAARIWDEQSEIARALASMKEVTYTRRRINGTLETVAQFANNSSYEFLNDPDAFHKYATSVMGQVNDGKETMQETGRRWAANALNLPRALMSTMDMSAPLRQGLFLIHKPAWWRSFGAMFRFWGDRKAFEDLQEHIVNRPTYGAMLEAKLALSNVDGKLSQREEDFQTEWANKIPGFGRLVRASERAYVGFLNKLRADVFDQMYAQLPDGYSPKDVQDIGRFINAATGRGNLHKSLQSSAPLLNAMLFSPRLMSSRLTLLTDVVRLRTYTQMNPIARKEYFKSLLAVGSLAFTILALASLGGAEVEKDPRSTDFAKIKVGNTRYDILGGSAQYITLAARVTMNSTKTADGIIKQYGKGYNSKSAFDAGLKFVRNKLAPVPSFFVDALDRKDAIGRPFELDRAVVQRMVPMLATNIYENAEEIGYTQASLMAIPEFFGVGANNYQNYSLDTDRELEAPDHFSMKSAVNGEYNGATVSEGTVKLDDETQEEWGQRVNAYYKEYMAEEVQNPDWKALTDDQKRVIIKEVRADARKDAKADMLEILGIEESE